MITMSAYFFGGKRFETFENAGITALAQRLMLKGAGPYNAEELADELEFYGIDIVPFHGVDTAGIRMKTLSRHFDKALELLHIIMCESTFPEDEFKKEKDNLLEDIRKEKDNLAWDIVFSLIRKWFLKVIRTRFPARELLRSVQSLTRDARLHIMRRPPVLQIWLLLL
jgi:predicted Zn-dependent peptidase